MTGKKRKLLKQSKLIDKLSHGTIVNEGNKRVTIYKFRKGKTVYQRKWMTKRDYRHVVRMSRERLVLSEETRGKKLPKGFKKIEARGTLFVFSPGRGRKAQKGTKEFIDGLRSGGLQVSQRKKKNDYLIKLYTNDQKKYLSQWYNDYSWTGRLREGTP